MTKPKRDCPCGEKLPWHMAKIGDLMPEMTHTCSCGRVFLQKDGDFTDTGKVDEKWAATVKRVDWF